MINRLGVFGGMFDPVHNGHVRAASYARELLTLDRVRLVPCAAPNHRSPAIASAEDRLRMLDLVTENQPGLEVDAQEIRRPGTSYTVDTLAALREANAATHLVFIMGQDAFATLPRWHQWERLFDLCHLLVLGRRQPESAGAAPPEAVRKRLVDDSEVLFSTATGNILVASEFQVPVSSSEVRHRLGTRADVSDCLDPAVQRYIMEHRLYQ